MRTNYTAESMPRRVSPDTTRPPRHDQALSKKRLDQACKSWHSPTANFSHKETRRLLTPRDP